MKQEKIRVQSTTTEVPLIGHFFYAKNDLNDLENNETFVLTIPKYDYITELNNIEDIHEYAFLCSKSTMYKAQCHALVKVKNYCENSKLIEVEDLSTHTELTEIQNLYESLIELCKMYLPNKIINSLQNAKQFGVTDLNSIAKFIIKAKEDLLHYSLNTSYESQIAILIKVIKAKYIDESKIINDFDITKLPSHVYNAVAKDFRRLHTLPKNTTEYHNLYDYFMWIFSLPWEQNTSIDVDIKALQNTLSESHFGLEEVKEHILEYVALNNLSKIESSGVICFLGPPGTGKTSIAQAIAKASNRKLVKIALGGCSDEAELRGHRRTYTGSRPGRIVNGIRTAGTLNPIIILDEIDKMTKNKGDPGAALLEILDPEQNSEFIDRYLEVPIDLSKVLFICTANYESQIEPALKDRMEIIEFRQYSFEERKSIFINYIFPKVISRYNLDKYNLHPPDSYINEISKIKNVREILQQFQKTLRNIALQIFLHNKDIQELEWNFKLKKQNKKLGFE